MGGKSRKKDAGCNRPHTFYRQERQRHSQGSDHGRKKRHTGMDHGGLQKQRSITYTGSFRPASGHSLCYYESSAFVGGQLQEDLDSKVFGDHPAMRFIYCGNRSRAFDSKGLSVYISRGNCTPDTQASQHGTDSFFRIDHTARTVSVINQKRRIPALIRRDGWDCIHIAASPVPMARKHI